MSPFIKNALTGVLAASMLLSISTTALAFQQTMTCYPKSENRHPSCEKKETAMPVRWFSGCTTWRTHVRFPDELLEPLQASFEVWNEVPGSYFQTYYAGSTDQYGSGYDCYNGGSANENVVTFVEDWPRSIAGSNVVALTSVTYTLTEGEILDADIRMNADHFGWEVIDAVSQDPQRVDLQNVMVHEVGHFLGLDHAIDETYVGDTQAESASMWALTYPNEIKRRVLDLDDVIGLETTYPLELKPKGKCAPPERLTPGSSPGWYDPTRSQCSDSKSKGCCSATESDPVPIPLLAGVVAALLLLRLRGAQRLV